MNVNLMRTIDAWVGVPACAAFSIWNSLCGRPAGKLSEPKRILIIHLAEMGAMVIARPALRHLQELFPKCELHYLVFPLVRDLLEELDVPAHCLHTITTRQLSQFALSSLQAVRQLRKIKFDACLDFEGFARCSSLLSYLCCPQSVRVGLYPYGMPQLYRGTTMTHRVQYNNHQHAALQYYTLVESLLCSPQDRPLPKVNTLPSMEQIVAQMRSIAALYRPKEEALHNVRNILAQENVSSGDRFVIINGNCSDMLPARRWDSSNYAETALILSRRYPQMHFVFTGTAKERPSVQAIVDECLRQVPVTEKGRWHNLAGRTSMPELLALYSLSCLLITNDSGPAHLAVLTQTPTLVLFGPETPKLFGPIGVNTRCVYAKTACSPCVSPYNGKNSPCRNNQCLKCLKPDYIASLAHQWLD